MANFQQAIIWMRQGSAIFRNTKEPMSWYLKLTSDIDFGFFWRINDKREKTEKINLLDIEATDWEIYRY